MALYSYIFGVFIAVLSYIVYQKYINIYTSVIVKPQKRYDYIIVGAGTAGCVLASRLSEDPTVTVLLLEAGDHMSYFTQIPLTPTAAQQGPNDWSVRTVPQKYSSFGLWRQSQIIPRGKGLGGSGQINFLLHGFGLPEDYDRWSRLGFKGWTLEDLKPYFIKAFGTVRSEFDSEHCSLDGVCPGNEIRFENRTASSVYILQNHRHLNNIFINKEVILSGGAIKTPQLLMLSGIGPSDTIHRLRIKLVAENERVGRNLHDHMNMPVYVSIKKPISTTLSKVFSFNTIWNYFWNKRGILSFPPVAGVEYQNASALMLFSMGTASEKLLRDLSNYKHKVFRDTFPFHNDTRKEGFMFLATCVQPRSRGTVSVTDASTTVPPAVDPNYLHQHYDVKCMIKAMRRIEQMVSTKAFKEIEARVHWPRVERCLTFWNYSKQDQLGSILRRKRRFKITSEKSNHQASLTTRELKTKEINTLSPPDQYLECIIREVAVTGHHVAGTCAGGAVVDEQLRVKSVKGVRVMDASILPSPISLYPNSVLIAMAERAVDLIQNTNTH
ncbi:neither inactivation nor afterpotential protein G isoform X2 [Galleria mellonella]|uniref:Neither inactivation nor afterpotential protein G isoform X2 n=1 Tax=Galleria mellonella TaxID=7137 RepID=A0ABM3M9B4_GALME|nr:neither inactivation nor afterpotential protein G isoform X2 [Galleria mellonella]